MKFVDPLKSRHLSWSDLNQRILLGVPFVHRIHSPLKGGVAADINVSENGAELSMWISCGSDTKIIVSPLKDVGISISKRYDEFGIEIRTRSRILFQETYNFFISIIDKVQLEAIKPEVAVEETVDRWRELMKAQSLMSEESQLGLMGELWLLRRLAGKYGDTALDAWTGPRRESHDFRINNCEFEVKTTRGSTHTHFINGLNQLEPSGGRSLYLLSLRVELAGVGAGTSLPHMIDSVTALLTTRARLSLLRILRETYGYDPEHASIYSTQLQLADPARLIPVLEGCPRLTRSMLLEIPLLDRIAEVRYRANFEGLGYLEGTPTFEQLLSLTTT